MTERILRARFEGDSSGLKRMAQEGKQAIDSVADAQERASREMTAATDQAESKMVAAVKSGAQRRIAEIQREANEAIKAIEKLPLAREEKERQIARVVETNAKRTSDILLQEIRKQERAHQQISDSMGSHSGAAIALTRNIAGLVAAYVSLQSVIGLAKQGLAGNADLQQAGLTFEVLFKDADRAKAKIEELYDFAAKTPFEFGPVKDAALALETFGLNSSDYLRDAGDLAAAFNAEISEVARVFGRINSGDFGEAFERLRDFGISRELLEGQGLVFDKSGSYQGSVDQALTAVQNIIREKFGGMMERQSAIANGQMSNLADNFQSILNSVMSPAFDTLTEAVSGLNTALDGAFGDEMQANIRVLGDIVNGVAVGALALGKAIGTTLDEMMAPLRWLRDTATALGAAAGQRDVARALVMSSDINPNRREHYAKLVGQGENVQGIARDFRVRSWGDPQGVQEDLRKIAEAITKARQIVEGTIQYKNFEPFGPPLPPGGVKTRTGTTTSTTTIKPLEGHQLFTAQHKAGDLTDEQYLARLNVELGKVVKNSSDYFAIREKIAGLKSDPWLDKIFEQSPGALDFRLGQFMQGNIGASLPITTLADRIGGAFETPTAMLGMGDPGAPAKAELFGPGYGKAYDEFLKREATKLQKLAEDADKALQSGLEAGLSAFLDGGIGNLGEATYSLSKDAFSKALVEGVMSSEVKDAVGALGESLGAALQHPVTAAIAVAAMGLNEIKKAFDQVKQHNQTLDGWKDQYLNPRSQQQKDVEQWRKERDAYQREADRDVGLVGALMGFGHLKAEARNKVEVYDDLIAAVEAQNQLADAAYAAAQALDGVARRGEVVSNSVSGTELWMKLAGIDAGTAEYDAGVVNAYRSGLNNAGFDVDFADRLVGDRELQKTIVGEYRGWSQDGFGTETSRDDWLVSQFGGRFEGEALKQLLQGTLLPMFERLADINPTTQAVGNLSNPDGGKLMFDAPQTRNIVNNNQFIVQAQAFMGNQAEAREFARMIGQEWREIEGQSV